MALAPARPAIKMKAGVRLPASVSEGPGISADLENGILTVGLDYPSLADNAGIPDPSIYTLAILNTSTQEYEEAPLDQLRSTTVAAVRTPVGDDDYSILTTDRVVALTAALTAARTWSLPTGLVGGTGVEIVDEVGGVDATNTLTITATGAETINGASSFVLNAAYAGARFVYDGTGAWTVELVGTTGIAPNAVTNAKLATMAALTVKANATNAVAAPTDVAAGTDGYLFMRSGTSLAFGQAATASLADGILSADVSGLAKMADGFLAASAGGLAKMADGYLSADTGGRAKMADRFNTFAKLPEIATSRILGRTTGGSGDIEELTSANLQDLLGIYAAIGIANNVGLSASVGSGALTISLTDAAGSAPSAASPVQVPFRSATAGTGTTSQALITAATTLVISSGSTMGFSSATAGRLWIVLFDDAGTYRLGAINCRKSDGIFPLRQFGIASSTAEGGAGAADSTATFYTGTAAASKAFTVLGYLEWGSGLTTAGTWDAAPSRVDIHRAGQPLPGDVVQSVINQTTAGTTGTTILPIDNTIPQISEGDEYMTQAITPTSAANDLEISASAILFNSAANGVAAAIFQDATAGALKASTGSANQAAGYSTSLTINHRKQALTTSSTTFRLRAGGPVAGTTTFNGQGGSQLFGGVAGSFLRVAEVMA